MTVVHEDPLEVEKSGRLVDVLAQDANVVVSHPQDLDLVVQVGRDGCEASPGAVSLPLTVGPLAVAVTRAVVAEVCPGSCWQLQ